MEPDITTIDWIAAAWITAAVAVIGLILNRDLPNWAFRLCGLAALAGLVVFFFFA